ncbi:MAG: nickel-dependent lactate racemase [Ruminococcaceae bacterium]|nr:nickel-dependent lactate racemase [Oscillospiraceae bacterium]
MNVTLGFAKEKLNITIDDSRLLGCLTPNKVEYDLTNEAEVVRSLASPIGSEKLSVLAKGKKDVVIVTSDITRPVPSYRIIPAILDELGEAGVADSAVTVVFALGSHRGHTEEEMRKLVGDAVFDRVRCIDMDPNDCVHLGQTKRGTPVDVFRKVAQADMRICVGNIEYHYFAGYSGGYKAIMPGVSTRDAIQSNHGLMIQEGACTGNLKNNPVREDIEEAGALCGVDFIVNVVLNEKKEIIKSVAGDVVAAHRAGCDFLDTLYKIKIPQKADIVLVTPGGFPKDLNMYQAQKALDNASHAVKDGGVIIWLASCKEGFGEHHFEEWMTTHEKSSDMIPHIRQNFVLGGHKAAAIAMVLEKAEILLVSELDDKTVSGAHLTPAHSVEEALEKAYAKMGESAKVLVMPYGGSTLPCVE